MARRRRYLHRSLNGVSHRDPTSEIQSVEPAAPGRSGSKEPCDALPAAVDSLDPAH